MYNKRYLRPAALAGVLMAAQMMTGCAQHPPGNDPASETASSVLEDALSETEAETGESLFGEDGTESLYETELATEAPPISLTDPEHAENLAQFLGQTKVVLGDDFRFPENTRRPAEPATEEETETLTEELTEAATESAAEWSWEEDLTEQLTEGITETLSEDLAKEVSEELTEGLSEDVTESLSENLSEGLTEEVSEELTEELTEETFEDLTEEISEGLTEGLTDEVSEDLTEDLTEEVSEGLTEDLTEEVSESLTEEVSEGLTEDLTEEASEDLTEDLTDGLTEDGTESLLESVTEEETETEPAPVLHELRHEVPYPDHVRTLEDHYRVRGLVIPAAQRTPYMLQIYLERMIEQYEGNWSIYVRNLNREGSGSVISINVQPVKSASIMKLFIMGAAYDAMYNQRLARTDEVISRITGMIKASSNTDANRLLEILGGGSIREGIREVNAYISRLGCSDLTHQYNGFDNTDYVFDPDHNNTVYPPDCALFMEKIYHRQLGSRKICNEIENMMLEQQTRYKIPAGVAKVSDGVSIGNKTGEMDQVENDVAIVYSPACDYIICVFSNGWTDKDTALKQIQSISEEVYRFYNDNRWLARTIHILDTGKK